MLLMDEMAENTDKTCVERARRGDPAAIGELHQRYWRAARAAAYGVTGNLTLAEDAASEAFCAALENLPSLRDPARFGPWLRTIVVRIAQRLKQVKAVASEIRQEGSSPSVQAERREIKGMIHEAVGGLSDVLREAIGLHYFEGYSIEEAARFLDVPSGTVKRRLHEGRRRLAQAMEQIAGGSKPMDARREQIVRRLRDLLAQDGDARQLQEAMRQALSLRPPPMELLEAVRKRFIGKALSTLKQDSRREHVFVSLMRRYHGPSERAKDPDHPVGAVAETIRSALPEFQEFSLDADQVILSMLSGKPAPIPSELAQGRPGSYLNLTRGVLTLKPDGSMLSLRELVERQGRTDPSGQKPDMRPCVTDVIDLYWNRSDGVELRAVETLLTRLIAAVVPGVSSRFESHDHPHYRAALLELLGDITIPAAMGGVLRRRPETPEGVGSAHVRLFLSSWATARTGEVFEPEDLPSNRDLTGESIEPEGPGDGSAAT